MIPYSRYLYNEIGELKLSKLIPKKEKYKNQWTLKDGEVAQWDDDLEIRMRAINDMN